MARRIALPGLVVFLLVVILSTGCGTSDAAVDAAIAAAVDEAVDEAYQQGYEDGLEEGAVLEDSDEEILGQVDTGFLSRCVAHVSIPDWYLILLRYDTDPILV